MSDTPRVNDNLITFHNFGLSVEMVKADFARQLERELARAMRVVEAAEIYESDYDDEALLDLKEAVREWRAGR